MTPYNKDMVRVRGGAPNRYQAPSMRMGRSQFDESFNHKSTFDAGLLIPYFVQEVVPGDTFTCKLNSLVRIFSPLDAPIMDNIHLDIDFFFVPNRLVWDNWQAFLGEHDAAGAQDTDFTVPIMADGGVVNHVQTGVGWNFLSAYFGLPHGLSTTAEGINALPFRAYNLIYNEWYRDQNLIGEVPKLTGNGPDSLASYSIYRSAKKPDYFTTALPYLQKGTASDVLMSGKLRVSFDGGDGAELGIEDSNDTTFHKIDTDLATADQSATLIAAANVLYVDLADAVGITINALREAAAVQRFLERDARGGTRYTEKLRAHFGVDVPDFRLQRPEYLGGGRGFVNVSPVANTSATASEDQGQLTGVGAGRLTGSFAKSFVEHGHVLGILRARGEVTYQQGLDRMWSRSTQYDFLWPEFAHLGEQEILNKELFIVGDATDDNVFGYNERYSEYRYSKSLVTGKLVSDVAGSLDFWHLAEDFGAQPTLNQTFVEDQTPMARVTTVDTEPDFIIDGRFDLRVARALPVRPVPSLAPARF